MAILLSFTLNPEGITKIHDALVCLGKFSEAVCIEATRYHMTLTALNSSKSAYASVCLKSTQFFLKYSFTPILARGQSIEDSKFTCKLHNKALLSAFKGRVLDPLKERDTAIERCDASLQDGQAGTESRLIIKMLCKHGVLKTYRLTFESTAAMHAVFDSKTVRNKWTISSRTLREFVEHFGTGTDQLDFFSDEGRVTLTSYTEKIVATNGVLKQPLHTSIEVDSLEFGEFLVEPKMHIGISVKDFRAIVTHAGIINTVVKALYSEPSRPMQISYGEDGMISEFILMTIGESRGSSATPAPARPVASRITARQRAPLEASSSRAGSAAGSSAMPPPPPKSIAPIVPRELAGRSQTTRPSPEPPQPSLDSDMFFPDERDDDRRWDPTADDDDEQDLLLWDANGSNEAADGPYTMRLRDEPVGQANQASVYGAPISPGSTQMVAPTQKLSQVRGLFDD